MSRPLLLVMLALAASACMHKRTPRDPAAAHPWVGRSLEELVAAEGYPARRHTSPKGHEVYEYRTAIRRPASSEGRVTYSSLYREEDEIVTQECVQWFEIQDKKILSVQTKGCE